MILDARRLVALVELDLVDRGDVVEALQVGVIAAGKLFKAISLQRSAHRPAAADLVSISKLCMNSTIPQVSMPPRGSSCPGRQFSSPTEPTAGLLPVEPHHGLVVPFGRLQIAGLLGEYAEDRAGREPCATLTLCQLTTPWSQRAMPPWILRARSKSHVSPLRLYSHSRSRCCRRRGPSAKSPCQTPIWAGCSPTSGSGS